MPSLLADFLAASEMHIYPSCQPSQISKAAELMSTYADTPMDFADATLVLLADRFGILEIVTLDRRGFSTYRSSGGKPFRRILDLR